MSIENFFVRDVTILRAGEATSRYGDTLADWSTATSTATRGWLARNSESEQQGDRDALVSGWVLRLPVATDITGRDRVTIDSVTYELDGPPNQAWTPRGEHHVRCALRVVDG